MPLCGGQETQVSEGHKGQGHCLLRPMQTKQQQQQHVGLAVSGAEEFTSSLSVGDGCFMVDLAK